jgi:hypothetical protein
MELMAVLAILIGTAVLVLPRLGSLRIATISGPKTAEQVGTEATMQQIRNVIMGTPSRPGVWSDVGQRPEFFPRSVSELFVAAPPHFGMSRFDPSTGIGWRGPYFTNTTGTDGFGNPTLVDAWGHVLVIQVDFDGDGLVDSDVVDYDGDGLADGNEADFARLVSAGPNGIIDTPSNMAKVVPGTQLTLTDCSDDIVLFLRVADRRQ